MTERASFDALNDLYHAGSPDGRSSHARRSVESLRNDSLSLGDTWANRPSERNPALEAIYAAVRYAARVVLSFIDACVSYALVRLRAVIVGRSFLLEIAAVSIVWIGLCLLIAERFDSALHQLIGDAGRSALSGVILVGVSMLGARGAIEHFLDRLNVAKGQEFLYANRRAFLSLSPRTTASRNRLKDIDCMRSIGLLNPTTIHHFWFSVDGNNVELKRYLAATSRADLDKNLRREEAQWMGEIGIMHSTSLHRAWGWLRTTILMPMPGAASVDWLRAQRLNSRARMVGRLVRYYGVNVVIDARPSTPACAIRSGDQTTIFVSRRLGRDRTHFAILHELSHIVLDHRADAIGASVRTVASTLRSDRVDDAEQSANELAVAAIIVIDHLVSATIDGRGVHGERAEGDTAGSKKADATATLFASERIVEQGLQNGVGRIAMHEPRPFVRYSRPFRFDAEGGCCCTQSRLSHPEPDSLHASESP